MPAVQAIRDLRNGHGSSQRQQSCGGEEASDPFTSAKFQILSGCFSFYFNKNLVCFVSFCITGWNHFLVLILSTEDSR